MKKPKLNRTTLALFAIATAVLLSAIAIHSRARGALLHHATSPAERKLASLPGVVLWAWERPEKLDFIDPEKNAVAFLAKTLYLRGSKVVIRPRLQPLDVPAGADLIAVARIETDRNDFPALSRKQMMTAVAELTRMASASGVVAVQVDFDATVSQRDFYRELLIDLRRELPISTALSITALASWCEGDDWLNDLPVDEAVPMLFRMGADRRRILGTLASGADFSATLCRKSLGISTDEPLSSLPRTRRIYIFSPDPWSPRSVQEVMETYK